MTNPYSPSTLAEYGLNLSEVADDGELATHGFHEPGDKFMGDAETPPSRETGAAPAHAKGAAMDEHARSAEEIAKSSKVTIQFPPKWVKLADEPIVGKDGRKWDAVTCTIPSGTRLNGVDISGYRFKTFREPWHEGDIANGRKPVNVRVSKDHDVSLFKFSKDADGNEAAKTIRANPWDLTAAVKAARERFAAGRTAANKPSNPADIAAAASQAARATARAGSDARPSQAHSI